MELITNDEIHSTFPFLLHFLFPFCPLSLFFCFCTLSLSSFSISPALWLLLPLNLFPLSTLGPFCCAACHIYLFFSVMSSPSLRVDLHQLKLQTFQIPLLKLTDFPLLSVHLSFHSSIHSPSYLLRVVTSSGAPSLLPTQIVLSQLGCGLDGSGPPLPSPRLHQQHPPQIQVIQQL